MGPPQPARGGINIEACARPIAVDHRISLPYYFRIAGTLLRQAKIYRDEKNLLDLYVILLRYSSLLCETIPKHRDYHAFKSREAEFFKNAPYNSSKLIDVLNELESLKPVVQWQITEHNRGGTVECNSPSGTYAASHRTEQNTPISYLPQPFVGSNNGSLQNFFPGRRHQVASLPSVQPDRQISKRLVNLPFPKEETLARHSILGPNGLHGQWTGPVAGIKVQYPSNFELLQSDITSLVPAILNQDGLHGPSIASPDSTKNDNEDMKSVLSLDDGRWSAPAEECTSMPSVSLEEELSQLNIRQPSPPPVLAEVHPERRPISPSSVADPTPGLATSETRHYHNLHVPVKLMECFLRVAEANTKISLETCGVLAGTLKKRTFYVTTLIIPKQKSTSDSCEATNEEELFEVQDMGSLFTLGWIHENLPVEQFIDRNIPESEPVKPADLEDTPFTLVEDQKGLMELAKKLKTINEFAVDLEHNQYRSFQGLTCLMQISTRTEDFVVDTLKLRIYIGLYLKEHFKDPTKRKVMHGADRDIMWLERDFHIYVCNLFDTGQASRVLQMERNSLEHLLHHFCGVTANKEYQNADWRLRPLSDEMIKYAREDTHYLLYIYDLMRLRLQRESTCGNDLLLEVQNRSNEICLQLYEKELLSDTSYLNIYGLQEHELNAKQLAVVSALHQWRDYMARQEDESTGYVLPNKALIEIAKKMPTTIEDLKRIVKSKYTFVEDNLDLIVDIVWNATGNSYAFERTAEQLKKERLEQLALKSMQATGEDTEMTPLDADNDRNNFDPSDQSSVAPLSMNKEVLSKNSHQQMAQTTVQELNKPTAFGALIGNSTSGRQPYIFGGFSNEQAESKVEKAKSSPAFYYPQLPGYISEVGRTHHETEGMQISRSLSGSEHGFQSLERCTGTGQPPDEYKEENQDPRGWQSFPPFGNRSDTQ